MSPLTPPLDRRMTGVGLATVILANVLYLSGILSILDPMMSMDPFYIGKAQEPLSNLLAMDPGWGPLYALYLKAFVAVLEDPLSVYAANLHWMSFGISLMIYLYVLLVSRRATVAVGAAILFVICDLNVPLFSKVTSFSVLLVLLGFTLSELLPAGARRMTIVAAAVLLASYARPELYVAALCLSAAAWWLGRQESEGNRSVLLWPAALIGVVVLAGVCFGTPLFSPYHDNPRLLMAFREHFAWNWSHWHNESRAFISIWSEEFGDAQSLSAALIANPGAFIHHVFDNFVGVLRFLTLGLFRHYPVLAPADNGLLVETESVLVAIAAFAALLFVAGRPDLRRQMRRRYGHALPVFALLGLISVASATLIYPEPYYLLMPAVLLLLTAALAASVLIPTPRECSWRRSMAAAVVCLAIVPKPFLLPTAYATAGSPFKAKISVSRTISDTIWFVRFLSLPPPVNVLTFTDGLGEMMGSGFHEIKIWQKGTQPLQDYIREQDIHLVVSIEPGENSFAIDDPYLRVLRNDPAAAGFTRLPVPGQDVVRVYVRTSLL